MKLLDKPSYGSPCNGCGLCCIAVQCPVSTALFGEREICPALVQERGSSRFGCGLMVDTAAFVPDLPAWGGKALTETFALLIGAGIGCDGTLEGEAPTNESRMLLRAIAQMKLDAASDEAKLLVEYFRSPADPAAPVPASAAEGSALATAGAGR